MASKFSEKVLLDNYQCLCNGGSFLSIIEGKEYWWEYRRGDWNDGYNPVTTRNRASEITVNIVGYIISTIEIDSNCDNHPTLDKILKEEAELYGTLV